MAQFTDVYELNLIDKEIKMKGLKKKIVSVIMSLSLIVAGTAVQSVNSQAAKKVTSLTLSAKSKTLTVGKSFTLKVKSVKPAGASKAVTWSSSNKSIASVSSKGKVTAKKAGSVNIVAVSKSNKKAKAVCKVKVNEAPSKDNPNPSTEEKEEVEVVYKGSYKNTSWTIDKNGLFVATGTGDMYDAYGDYTCRGWSRYAKEIKTARLEVTGITNLANFFFGCSNLTGVDLSKLDTSQVRDMSYMFYGCSSLTGVDISMAYTSNVETMRGMFGYCTSMPEIDLSTTDTLSLTDMSYMFVGCTNLYSVQFSRLRTTYITNLEHIFSDCVNLWGVDLSMLDTSGALYQDDMFEGCDNLITIITPSRTSSLVTDLPGDKWLGSDGKTYTKFPESAVMSITLTKQS